MGKLGNGEILTVRSCHETVPVDARTPRTTRKDVQGVTFGDNRSIRFSGGDNDTKYHISLPLGFLTDKNGQRRSPPRTAGRCTWSSRRDSRSWSRRWTTGAS